MGYTPGTREIGFLWRQNPVRMEAQVIRDSLLHLAGRLEPRPGAARSTRRRRLEPRPGAARPARDGRCPESAK